MLKNENDTLIFVGMGFALILIIICTVASKIIDNRRSRSYKAAHQDSIKKPKEIVKMDKLMKQLNVPKGNLKHRLSKVTEKESEYRQSDESK